MHTWFEFAMPLIYVIFIALLISQFIFERSRRLSLATAFVGAVMFVITAIKIGTQPGSDAIWWINLPVWLAVTLAYLNLARAQKS